MDQMKLSQPKQITNLGSQESSTKIEKQDHVTCTCSTPSPPTLFVPALPLTNPVHIQKKGRSKPNQIEKQTWSSRRRKRRREKMKKISNPMSDLKKKSKNPNPSKVSADPYLLFPFKLH